MWRVCILLAGCCCSVLGCNSLLGIHEIDVDAAGSDSDPCYGTCECKVDTDCVQQHTVCLDEVTKRSCVCSAGYTESGATCTWTGVVADPAMANPVMWMTSGMAAVAPTPMTTGMLDLGIATIPMPASCNAGAVKQSIVMPRRSRSDALVALVNARLEAGGGGNFYYTRPALGVGVSWIETGWPYSFSSWSLSRRCLGAGNYALETTTGRGAAVQLEATLNNDYCNGRDSALSLDHLELRPADAGECPDPGKVLNGDAEGNGGWTFYAPAGAFAGLAATGGEAGSKSIRLFSKARCDSVSASTQMSVPLPDGSGSPALSLYHSTSANYLTVYMDSGNLQLSGGTQPTIERYCMPAGTRGGVFSISAQVYPGGAGACTDVVNNEAFLDNITVTNDSLCGSDPAIADPSFESGLSLMNVYRDPGRSNVIVDSANAHDGTRSLRLSVSDACGSSWQRTSVITPMPAGNAGPALTFWYQLPQAASTFYVQSYGGAFTPVRDGQWHQGKACLDPRRAGRESVLYFQLYKSGTCAAQAAELVWIDALAVTTDAACPAM